MLGPEGQRRALHGLEQAHDGDIVSLLHRESELLQWPPDPGYPRIGDRDSDNDGRGERVVTWRVTIPESVILGNTVTRARVRDHSDYTIAQGDFPNPQRKDPGKLLIVYVNVTIQ